MALGATKSDILRLVMGSGVMLATVGVAVGVFLALGLTGLLSGILYQVSRTDPATYVVVGLVLTLVALLASYLPAWRASTVDPMRALHHD